MGGIADGSNSQEVRKGSEEQDSAEKIENNQSEDVQRYSTKHTSSGNSASNARNGFRQYDPSRDDSRSVELSSDRTSMETAYKLKSKLLASLPAKRKSKSQNLQPAKKRHMLYSQQYALIHEKPSRLVLSSGLGDQAQLIQIQALDMGKTTKRYSPPPPSVKYTAADTLSYSGSKDKEYSQAVRHAVCTSSMENIQRLRVPVIEQSGLGMGKSSKGYPSPPRVDQQSSYAVGSKSHQPVVSSISAPGHYNQQNLQHNHRWGNIDIAAPGIEPDTLFQNSENIHLY